MQQRKADRQDIATDPAALRGVFGDNLRALCAGHKSVSELCRTLGINRTQFNRYLSGESFPRPDILHRICRFFGTDARILLEPISEIDPTPDDLVNHPFLRGFFGPGTMQVSPELFPSGIYRFARKSFYNNSRFLMGLVLIRRSEGYTFLRGVEPRKELRKRGMSTDIRDLEYRGVVMRQEEGIMAVVTHRDSLACSFNFLTPETAFQSNIWEGYVTRTVREKVTGSRATRLVYEHLGDDPGEILRAARDTGAVPVERLPSFYVHLLRPDEEFR